jgi:uncharacterized membrane protein HdeD (DUF308 family)
MKAFLITTGILFGLMSVVHIWRAIDEWPDQGASLGFVLGMTALILVPGALSAWAWWCLCKPPKHNQKKDSDDSAA